MPWGPHVRSWHISELRTSPTNVQSSNNERTRSRGRVLVALYERPVMFGPCQNRSFHLLQQLPRFIQQGLNLLALRDRVLGEQAVLARVLVSPRRAGFRRTAVHAAAL